MVCAVCLLYSYGDPYTGKMKFLYWDSPQEVTGGFPTQRVSNEECSCHDVVMLSDIKTYFEGTEHKFPGEKGGYHYWYSGV